MLDQIGIQLPPELIALLNQVDYNLADSAVVQGVIDLIPDDLVDHLAVAGTIDEVSAHLIQIVRLGIDELAIWPFPPHETDLEHELIPLAREVLPRVYAGLASVPG